MTEAVTNDRVAVTGSIKTAYWRAYEHQAPRGMGWTIEQVRTASVEAHSLLARVSGRIGPAGPGSGLPFAPADDVERWLDLNAPGWRAPESIVEPIERIGAERVTWMDRVLEWQARYLVQFPTLLMKPTPLAAFKTYVVAGARGRKGSVKRAFRARGWNADRAETRVEQACAIIALGLMRAGVQPPPIEEEPEVEVSWDTVAQALSEPQPEPLPAGFDELVLLGAIDRSAAMSQLWRITGEEVPDSIPGNGRIRRARFHQLKRVLIEQIEGIS